MTPRWTNENRHLTSSNTDFTNQRPTLMEGRLFIGATIIPLCGPQFTLDW